MAKNASELKRKVLQNIRTTKSDAEISSILSGTVAMGEIAVQLGSGANEEEKRRNTGLWTLAQDGNTAVRFPSVEEVNNMITSGASISVDNVIEAVGLQTEGDDKGKLPVNWVSGTSYVSASTNVIDAIKDLDEAIKTIDDSIVDELEVTGVTDSTDKVLVDLKQHEGLIGTATTKHVGEFTLAGYTGGTDTKIAAEQTLNAALGNLQAQIDAMDKTGTTEDGKVVTYVTEADGKVSENKELLTTIKLNGYTGTTGTVTANDTVGQAIDKIEKEILSAKTATSVASADGSITVTTADTGTDIAVNIKSGEKVLAKDGNAGLYTDIKLDKITTGVPEYVKERYQLTATDGTKLGEYIDVPKDSHIVSIDFVQSSQTLEYKYIDASGATQTTDIDMSELILETEFGSGVTVENHVARGVVDPTSEKFLTVDGGGFKLSGVQAAIDAAKASGKTEINTTVGGDATKTHMGISASTAADGHTVYEFGLYDVASAKELANLSGTVLNLDATVTGKTADDHVAIEIVETDGKLTSVTLTGTDIASASALTAEIERAKAAETEIANLVGITGNEGSRSYDATGNYLGTGDNKSVKEDIQTLDSIIGSYDDGTTATTYDVTFSTGNTVAKSISDIKKAIDEAKSALTLSATDDKYINTEVISADTGTTIGISAVTGSVVTATSSNSALVDSWDAKQNLVHELVDNTREGVNDWHVTKTAAADDNSGVTYDFTNLVVDCGTF